jgi:hypothetical protein
MTRFRHFMMSVLLLACLSCVRTDGHYPDHYTLSILQSWGDIMVRVIEAGIDEEV